jgi:hypothetical protein
VQTLNPTIGFAISCMSYIDAWSRGKLNVKRGLGFEVKKSGKRLTHIAKQQPQTTCTCIDYGQGPFTHTRLNMGGSEAVGTIFNTDLCQFGLVFQPTNEQVAECTQIPWNEAVRDDIYVRRGPLSIPPVSWTHGQFWFSKVLRKWHTSAFQNYKYQAPISTPCIFMYTFRPTLKRTTNTHQLQRLLSLSYFIQTHNYLVKQFKVLLVEVGLRAQNAI